MSSGPIAEALSGFRRQVASLVQEREILRVVASVEDAEPLVALAQARREILLWAQKRSGGKLPKEAWEGKPFDILSGGRTTMAVRIDSGSTSLWALRGDDPDKGIPGRIWTTETTIGWDGTNSPRISVRQIVSSPEAEITIAPHVPGFLQQITARSKLKSGASFLSADPWFIADDNDAEKLTNLLQDKGRKLTVVVASGDERKPDPVSPTIDTRKLARAALGLAIIAVIPANLSYRLTDTFGKARSVFHGAVRTYLPGFSATADPYEHPLFLSESLRADPEHYLDVIRLQLAQESLRRTRIGVDVLSFASVRSAALGLEQQLRIKMGASETEQLKSALRRIEALQAEVEAAKTEANQSFEAAVSEEERAKLAEAQWNSARIRIQSLLQTLSGKGIATDDSDEIPTRWADFADWADRKFVGRLVLTPLARRGLRSAEFSDIPTASRCLKWLATTCLDRRVNGGGSISNIPIEAGIENAPCGSDAFGYDFQGRRISVDWHVRDGGRTRDPSRSLSIYYGYDDATQQIIIADMPAHRRSGAS